MMYRTHRICAECAKSFTSRQSNANFCCGACKRDFNNRRAKRGAVLYDLVMIKAFDAASYEKYNLAGVLEEGLRQWRDEDAAAKRHRSWKRPNEVMYDTAEMLRS